MLYKKFQKSPLFISQLNNVNSFLLAEHSKAVFVTRRLTVRCPGQPGEKMEFAFSAIERMDILEN